MSSIPRSHYYVGRTAVRGQEHGGAAPYLIEQDLLHEPGARRIHALECLVKQEQFRAMGDDHPAETLNWL
jgi:hypothetical protein